MASFAHERCVACRNDSPRVAPEDIAELKSGIPAWSLVERDGILRLERTYGFADVAQALTFTNNLRMLAEEEGHHPVLQTDHGNVTVLWWTHAIKWLHRNDFIMAAKTDQLYGAAPHHGRAHADS
jgi:4a-hydroxytetrahydrobiopterin dehydratase